MDSDPTDDQTGVEEASKAVEVVMETEAEAGASGYSVTGGGERGIFVKDVLKDSPAAKHLSLQQGDQLLSAKVYFDNVRYEDALKILQCAEPYKVSFQLKRTIPGAEVSIRPQVPSVEVKGPTAKMAKMSVKGNKPFKTKKKRGGRFGLKRLKEKRREELVIEGTPPRLEMRDVDVEFSLPKMKQGRSTQTEAADAGKAKRKIRFPHIKAKGKNAGTAHNEEEINILQTEMPQAKIKTQEKGHKFGITLPKTKNTKSGSALETGSVELKSPSVEIQSPSVEYTLSGGISPNVEVAFPSAKAEASLLVMKGKTEIRVPEGHLKGGIDTAEGKPDIDTGKGGKGDANLRMPKLKLPKVRISRHSDEIDGDIKVKAEGLKMPHADITHPKVEIKGDGKICLPDARITKPKNEDDLSGKTSIHTPSVDISSLKGKIKPDISINECEGAGKTSIKMLTIGIAAPDVDLQLDAGRQVPDEVEGTCKKPKISMPKVDNSFTSMDNEYPEGGKISLPQAKIEGTNVDMDYYVGGDGKFKMPDFNISSTKIKSPGGEVNIKGQEVEVDIEGPKVKAGEFELVTPHISLSKSKTEGDVEGYAGKEGDTKMPATDISLPMLRQPKDHKSIERPELEGKGQIHMPSVDMSLPRIKIKDDTEKVGPSARGGKFKIQSLDVSLPKVTSPQADLGIKGSEVTGGEINIAAMDISLSKGSAEQKMDIEGPSQKDSKFKTPTCDISLPKVNIPKGNIGLEASSVDISISKGKAEIDTENKSRRGHFHMPSIDVSLPKINSKQGDIHIEAPEIKSGEIEMPTIDISAPQGILECGINVEGEGKEGIFCLPSLPAVQFPEGDATIQGPKVKTGEFDKMTKIDISIPKGETVGDVNIDIHSGKDRGIVIPAYDIGHPKGKVTGGTDIEVVEGKGKKIKMPKFDISTPEVNFPESDVKFKAPDIKDRKIKLPDIDISHPKGKVEGEVETGGHGSKEGKFHMPSIHISLPKIKTKDRERNIKCSERKGGKINTPDIGLSIPKGKMDMPEGKIEGDLNIDRPEVNVTKIKMPNIDEPLPNLKLPEGGIKMKGQEIKVGKIEMPDTDVSLSKGKKAEELGMQGHDAKEAKFYIPSVDFSLPKIKTKGPEMNIEHIPNPEINVESSDEKSKYKVKFPQFKLSSLLE